MKKLFIIIMGMIVVIVVAAYFFVDPMVRSVIEKYGLTITGLKMGMDGFDMGVLNKVAEIENLRLYNPEGFKDKIMLDMPRISVNYDLPAVLKGKLYFQEMRVNMRELAVVKNEKGEVNLNSLNIVRMLKSGEKADPGKEGDMPGMKIGILELKIGKVIYKDYSSGAKPSVREFNVNVNERFTNITDPNALVTIIMVKALMNTTIARLTKLDLVALQGTVKGTLAAATKITSKASSVKPGPSQGPI